MIKIRRPTVMGDQTITIELERGKKEIDSEIQKGSLIAINRNSERIILQDPEEIKEEDEILVFPRIGGGYK